MSRNGVPGLRCVLHRPIHGARVIKNTWASLMPFCTNLLGPSSIRARMSDFICRTFGCATCCDWSICNGAELNGSVYWILHMIEFFQNLIHFLIQNQKAGCDREFIFTWLKKDWESEIIHLMNQEGCGREWRLLWTFLTNNLIPLLMLCNLNSLTYNSTLQQITDPRCIRE